MVIYSGDAWHTERGALSTCIQLQIMNPELKLFNKEKYVSVTLTETVMTIDLSKTIFKLIHDGCESYNCNKVLLNGLTLEKRELANHQLREIAEFYLKTKIAFLCRPELIDKQAAFFSAVTYSEGYMTKYFSVKAQALNWLTSQTNF